ncbi:MAG: DUF2284 domain-containing protein [Deltaproteobacteria bacterium]|nr:DUF2284 domain-containing protein [Deltaproteobacteria bacterium]
MPQNSGYTCFEDVKEQDSLIEDRVTVKCQVPRCPSFGLCTNCPPHTIEPARMRELITEYNRALFFSIDLPAENMTRDKEKTGKRLSVAENLYKIVSKIESMAFYDGLYMAFGLGAGSCLDVFCFEEKNCAALKEGGRCRYPLKARPSMEAVGIDVFKLMAHVGWDIYPIGVESQSEHTSKGTLAALVILD